MSFRASKLLAHSIHADGSGTRRATGECTPDQPTLTIDARLLRRIVSHMRRCLPLEGVGLLAATRGRAGPIADAYYPGTNVAMSATRFRMDSQEVHRAFVDLGRRGTYLGAVIHSHPTTVAEPSPIDVKETETTLADALSIIVGFEPRLSIRAWRLLFTPSGKAFAAVECPIEVTSAAGGTRSCSRILAGWLKT